VTVEIAVQRRIVLVLAATQVLGGVGVAGATALSSLVAARLSGSAAVAGLVQTGQVLGAAVASLVIARIAARAGRRPALCLGYGVAALGGAVAVAALSVGSAAGLLVALVLIGSATASGLAARFAATDLAAPEQRARSLAMVVWATTVGAVAGPNLAGPLQGVAGWVGMVPTAGPFLLCTCAFAVAAAWTWVGLRPDPLLLAHRAEGAGGEPAASGAEVRAALWTSPAALLGLAGLVLSHLVMVGLMTMTPVHMDHGGAPLTVVGLVISLHIAGMYALSPVFGWLADRVGRARVLALSGALLLASGVLCAVAGPADAGLLTVGLVLLGLGWSAGLVSGSALLSESVPARVRTSAQGLSDVAMNVSGAVGSVVAGLVVTGASYAVVGVAAAVLVVPYLVAAGAAGLRRSPATT
jgi:MFS family permease